MLRGRRALIFAAWMLLVTGAPAGAGAHPEAGDPAEPTSGHAPIRLRETDARVGLYRRNGRVMRLYGEPFSGGASPEASAGAFLDRHAARLGAAPEDLRLVRAQPVLHERQADRYRFTLLTYAQSADGVPVFRGEIKLLLRNDAGHPLVWVNPAALRPAAGFRAGAVGDAGARRGRAAAIELVPALTRFDAPRLVVWAGVDDLVAAPRLAWVQTGRSAIAARPDYRKRLFVTDAGSGAVLHTEDLILRDDIVGTVSARSTQGGGADVCGPEEPVPFPYARVSVGGTVAYADAAGGFVIPNAGGDEVTVASPVRGRWFRVFNAAGPDTFVELAVIPPGPAHLLHNETNDDEFRRAEVNAYVHANVARDFVLGIMPEYPVIASETAFPVNVNIDEKCNGYYDGASINFFTAGGACSNSAFSSFVHHEYGHRIIHVAGNGNQGAYGEGMADSLAALIADDPGWAYGFRTPCDEPRRTADNDCRYDETKCSTCGVDVHGCGQLLSGCIWDTRNELVATEPDEYRTIIAGLAIGSIFLHNGSLITPSLAVDFLTLDDDDGNIFNGTPHDVEIATGFGRHGLDAPVRPIGVEFPDGRSETIAPAGATLRVVVVPLTSEPQPGSGVLYLDDGGGVLEIPMEEIEPNVYDATFPPAACGTRFTYYFSAETIDGARALWPFGAPESRFTAFVADTVEVVFSDDFETDRGWTVVDSEDLIRGTWERDRPIGDGLRGDPPADADGSGQCYLTDNRPGNSDVDNGSTTLISPRLDAGGAAAVLSYDRWFSNTRGIPAFNDTFEVALSADDGATWTVAELIGPRGDGVDGGWIHRELLVSDFVEGGDRLRVRFTASDPIPAAVVEAAVDGVTLRILSCAQSCPADLDDSGQVDIDDALRMLAVWGPCAMCPEDLDRDETVGFEDLVLLLDAWGPCP